MICEEEDEKLYFFMISYLIVSNQSYVLFFLFGKSDCNLGKKIRLVTENIDMVQYNKI